MKNVYWLIDGSYIYKALKTYQISHTDYNLDYVKLRKKIETTYCANGEKLVAYYFNSTPDPASDSQNRFHSWLKSSKPTGPNIRVEIYPLKNVKVKCDRCSEIIIKRVQKGVDVGLVTTALKFAGKYDKLVISAGDGDFLDTVRYLKEDLDKEIYLVAFRHGLSADLQQYSDESIYIDDFPTEVQDTRTVGRIVEKPFDEVDDLIENDVI